MGWRWLWGAGLACALVFAGPARAGASFEITLVPDAHAVRVSGSIEPGFADSVQAALVSHPDARLLIVHSRGGLLHEARELAAMLNARHIAIRAEGRCASACAVLWAATDRRQLTSDARLGLHRSRSSRRFAWLRAWFERRSDRANVRTFIAAGFPPELASRAARTPSSSMYWVDAEELQRERVAFALQ